MHNLGTSQHANLHCIHANVADYRINLRFNHIQINSLNFRHAKGVLRSDCSHHRHAVST